MRQAGGRGQALFSVLFLSVSLLVVMFVASGTWLFQTNLQARVVGNIGARRLAESVAQVAIAQLLKNPALEPGGWNGLDLQVDSYPGGHGYLTINTGEAANWQIPLSVNNLKGEGSAPGWGSTVVAAQTASLVSVGRYRGVEERLEVVLYAPRFPYVIASSVPLKAVDGLRVFGLSSLDALANGFDQLAPEDRTPGHVATNAENPSGGNPALELLGSGTEIEGDAQARGQVDVNQGALVKGELRPFSDPIPLPQIDVTSFDVASQAAVTPITTASLNAAELSGFNRCSGDLDISGGLKLNGGVIYVDGSLNVQGGVTGTGAIIATGGVQISGGGALTTDNQAAILAGGSVVLHGTPAQRSEFRGLLYTQGNLDCKYANISGAVVVNNPNPNGQALLEQVSLAQSPQLAALEFGVTTQTAMPATPGVVTGDPRPNSGGLFLPTNGLDLPPTLFGLPGSVGADPSTHMADFQTSSNPPSYSAPDGNPFTVVDISVAVPVPGGGTVTMQAHSQEEYEALLLQAHGDISGLSAEQQAIVRSLISQAGEAAAAAIRDNLDDWASQFNAMAAWDAANHSDPPEAPVEPGFNTVINGNPVRLSSVHWKLDFSQFLNLSEQVRVLSWRRI